MLNIIIITTLLILSSALYGCDVQSADVTQYREIINMTDAPQARRQTMPNDDIHAGLSINNQSQMDMRNVSPAMQAQLDASVADTPIHWSKPDSWSEKAGNGMRVVTFNSTDHNNTTETSIIALSGSAGGTEANLTRWARQIGLNQITPDALLEIKSILTTQDQRTAEIFDFTALTESNNPSMLSAIIETKDSQIFIKMTGKTQAILTERDNFNALIEGLSVSE